MQRQAAWGARSQSVTVAVSEHAADTGGWRRIEICDALLGLGVPAVDIATQDEVSSQLTEGNAAIHTY